MSSAVQLHASRDPTALHKIVHAVEGFQKCGFAAAGGTDKGAYLILRYSDADRFERLKGAVIKIEIFNCNFIHIQLRMI